MINRFGRGLAAALALMVAATPLAAQHYSDGYSFIKAVRERDGAKATELINQPTIINSKDRDSGEAALHILVRGRDLDWLRFLLSKGARPDIQDREGSTPLSLAAQLGWLEGADLLLARRASVDLPNQKGETPLILAVHRRDLAMVRLLLSRGANPRKTDNIAGYSAIDYAKRDLRAAAIARALEAGQAAVPSVAGPKL